jgi:hypothetical protein
MAEVTFLIPEKDKDRVQGLHGMAGVDDVRVIHKPFDPFGADAETQVVAEAALTVSYDPTMTSVEQIREAFRSLDIHVLDVRSGE